MTDWEDILNAYLEGRGLRADAEDLLMRLHLNVQDRDLIERSLRLADQVTTALRQSPQPSAGSDARLLEVIRACPAPAVMPEDWRARGEEFAAATSMMITADVPVAEEDLLDAVIEGRVSLNELRGMRERKQLAESARDALGEIESVEEGMMAAGGTLPGGMEERLLATLRAYMGSEAGEVDAKLPEKILGTKAGKQQREKAQPDVLAAEEEPEGGE
jgi:hypothetical protein